ncbi:MAG TPA: CpXC domain-containing protein [Anaerolineaceae bacterium]|nr:CpXC domain-containing protein [Anaerolineaceae bacterium]
MPQTRTSCPRCRQPVTVDVEQLFDVNADPEAKQRFLSGAFNIIQCPNCGYEGPLPSPLVYHDPEKELLLTFFPPELGLPVNEQERLIGPLITQVVNRLPNEKRKGYLFRPQSMLTMQHLVERVLEADGITREMIQAQQQRVNLIQRLMTAAEESRLEIIKNEEALIDQNFFALLNRLVEASLAAGDEAAARQLADVQKKVMENTEVGKELKTQVEEAELAVKSLQEASQKGLTREALLDLLIAAPNETRFSTLVSLARNGMDYQFFQLLSERIEHAEGDERQRLTDMRERLLQITAEIDKAVKSQVEETHALLETILKAANIEEEIMKHAAEITQMFVDVLRDELQQARQKGDLARSGKLQEVFSTLQKMSAPPPEYDLIEKLISAENEAGMRVVLEEHRAEITPEFMQLLGGLAGQSEAQDPALAKQLAEAYRVALRFSMEANLKKG